MLKNNEMDSSAEEEEERTAAGELDKKNTCS